MRLLSQAKLKLIGGVYITWKGGRRQREEKIPPAFIAVVIDGGRNLGFFFAFSGGLPFCGNYVDLFRQLMTRDKSVLVCVHGKNMSNWNHDNADVWNMLCTTSDRVLKYHRSSLPSLLSLVFIHGNVRVAVVHSGKDGFSRCPLLPFALGPPVDLGSESKGQCRRNQKN